MVMTERKWNGNLGGLTGANAKCLQELQDYPWRGKTDAQARGILTDNNVKAFLCDGSTCNNTLEFVRYYYARATSIPSGGAFFETGLGGTGPNNSISWNSSSAFDVGDEFWSGRAQGGTNSWGTTPAPLVPGFAPEPPPPNPNYYWGSSFNDSCLRPAIGSPATRCENWTSSAADLINMTWNPSTVPNIWTSYWD
jgi:hypothetical protein